MEDDEEAPQLVVEKGSDASCTTFTLHNEDHTIGNVLRHVLNTSPEVDFVGYSVPHPSEPFVHVRLQTTGAPARDVLDDGLKQLGGICDALAAQLDKAEGLAETRKRSDSQGTAFPGPGRALENARRLADRDRME